MNTRNPLLISGVLAALAIPSMASAAAPSHQCSQLWDDALRLGCYDTAFGKPMPPAAGPPAVSPPAPVSAAPAAAAAAVVASAPPAVTPAAAPAVAAASVAPAAVAAPAAPVAAPAVASSSKEKAKQPDSGVTTVTALGSTLDGRFRVTLENGQVWEQLERYPPVQVKVGDRVTLKKATFGSYQLVVPSGLTAKVTQLK
jgi:hypothetical protein